MKCALRGCDEDANEYVILAVGVPRRQLKVDICVEHHRQIGRGAISPSDFSIGNTQAIRKKMHLPGCRYSDQKGWECMKGCPTGVQGLHGV